MNATTTYYTDFLDQKELRILCIGDPHFKSDNLYILDRYIQEIERHAANECDLVVIMGDVLHHHERVSVHAMNYAYKLVDTLRKLKPVFVLVGNHDMVNNTQFLTTNHWMNGMKEWNNVTVVDKGVILRFGYMYSIVLAPYCPPGQFRSMLDQIEPEWPDAVLILCHQEFYGANLGPTESTIGDVWNDDDPFVVSGHIHTRQHLGKKILYCGSSMQHAFGESPDKSIELVHVTPTGCSWQPIFLHSLPKKVILYVDELSENILDGYRDDDCVCVVVRECVNVPAAKKSRAYKALRARENVKIMFKPAKVDVPVASVSDTCTFEQVLYQEFDRFREDKLQDLYKSIQ